jgi:hypothetical protein
MTQLSNLDAFVGIWEPNSGNDYCLTCAEEMSPGITSSDDDMAEFGFTLREAFEQPVRCRKCKGLIQ